MGSKPSKAKRPTSTVAETKTPALPRIPQDIIDEILDHLGAVSDYWSLKSCALVSKSWVPSSRRHLFHTVLFTMVGVRRWVKALPVPEESPARHVRDLRFSIGDYHGAPEEFAEHILWFRNAETLTLLGRGVFQPLWRPSPWRFPPSITSLAVRVDTVTLLQIRDIMEQLPNLDDLLLSGSLLVVDGRRLPGAEPALMGRFGGKLRLSKGCPDDDVVDVLLEVPTGLHFADVQICGARECVLSTVRLAEACSMTLVKLSYTAPSFRKSLPILS